MILKKSTKKIMGTHGWRLDRALHNYLYFNYYDRYVVLFLALGRWVAKRLYRLRVGARLFRGVFERYHAKVITLEDATRLLSLKEDVRIDQARSERVIPYKYANRIILSEPDHIAVMDCPCRSARSSPCLPVDVCLAVGRPTVDFWLEHGRKYNVRKITQDEALQIIRESHARGEITTAWFKVATGGRTGVICSCCTCCCGALEGMRLAQKLEGARGITNISSSGYVVEVDERACTACGTCAGICFFDAVGMRESCSTQDNALCVGCGLCVEHCLQNARRLVRDSRLPEPLDIDALRG